MKFYYGVNDNPEIVSKSSSGGVFSHLAVDFLQKGGIIYGAVFNDKWQVVHSRFPALTTYQSTNYKNIYEYISPLRRSKYVFSFWGNTFAQIEKDLLEGKKILFSGCPCQIAAIKKKFGETNNLLTVEVICHGAPEPKYWTQYLKELISRTGKSIEDIKDINFRDKKGGWENYNFTILFKDGHEYSDFYWHNLYLKSFILGYTIKEACFKCPFKYPNGSKADISLGDFWGLKNINPSIYNKEGTNIIITNTEKGDNLIQSLGYRQLTIYLNQIYQFNPAISSSTVKPFGYNNFRKKAYSTKNLIGLMNNSLKSSLLERTYLRIKNLKNTLLRLIEHS